MLRREAPGRELEVWKQSSVLVTSPQQSQLCTVLQKQSGNASQTQICDSISHSSVIAWACPPMSPTYLINSQWPTAICAK